MNNQKWRIAKSDPKTGFMETIWFTGSKQQVPDGWKIVNHPENGQGS